MKAKSKWTGYILPATLISPNSDSNTELMQVAQRTNIKLP